MPFDCRSNLPTIPWNGCPPSRGIRAHHRVEHAYWLLEVLRDTSPAFDVTGPHRDRNLKEMLSFANGIVKELVTVWSSKDIRRVLEFARSRNLCAFSERLERHLDRDSRSESFDPEGHSAEKTDWLADDFFARDTHGLMEYADFVRDGTAFSTQHGVKGEEYDATLVVFDDIEAGWSHYSFTKLLIPNVVGEGTEGQLKRSRKLAYVCFTRARRDLQIILFCPKPEAAKAELVKQRLFREDQVNILDS